MNLFMVDSVGERRHVMCEGFHHQDGCWLCGGGKGLEAYLVFCHLVVSFSPPVACETSSVVETDQI